jgi:SAM-dependent methyltransferase
MIKKRVSIPYYLLPTCLLLSLFFATLSCHSAVSQVIPEEQEKPKLDVPYEPSSEHVVGSMLDIAQVGKNDFVYDLGCGDGRIVIAAAQARGARGVGVDLDPERIKESLENTRKANVADRVKFLRQDLFKTDISKATVVMLYLWPEVNLRLRPKLLRELKPGTRVVSHSHDMENWEADRTITSSDGHRVRLWVIPANVTGTWEWDRPGEKERYLLKLSQQFQKVSGVLQRGSDEFPVRDLELTGDRIQFSVERPVTGQPQTVRFAGTVQGHLIEGTEETMFGSSKEKRTWKATRNPSSITPLD